MGSTDASDATDATARVDRAEAGHVTVDTDQALVVARAPVARLLELREAA